MPGSTAAMEDGAAAQRRNLVVRRTEAKFAGMAAAPPPRQNAHGSQRQACSTPAALTQTPEALSARLEFSNLLPHRGFVRYT